MSTHPPRTEGRTASETPADSPASLVLAIGGTTVFLLPFTQHGLRAAYTVPEGGSPQPETLTPRQVDAHRTHASDVSHVDVFDLPGWPHSDVDEWKAARDREQELLERFGQMGVDK